MSDQEAEQSEEELAADEDPQAGLEDGDFVRLAYTARTVEDGTLVDTTEQAVAAEEGVDEEGREFEPQIIVIGAGHIFESVEDDLVGKAVGEEGSVTVPAGEAFGEYDEGQVRTVSAEKIPEDERYPGAHVEVDGEHGHVETIIGGRARVDFNHPLAGEDVEYEYEVVEVIEDRVEQAKGLLGTAVDVDLEVSIETDEVEEQRRVEPDEADEGEADDGEDAGEGEAADDGGGAVGDEDADEGEDAEDDEDAEPEPEFETVTVEKETLYIESTPELAFNQQWMFQKQQIAQDVIDRLGLDRVIIRETIEPGAGMGMGGMMPGMGGGGGVEELAEELDEDVDAEDLAEELDADLDEA